VAGVLSMARSSDPNEASGAMPRPEFANSAGSQFFICLDYANTKQLDGRYTAFGQVVEGMQCVRAIAALPTDEKSARPVNPPKIVRAEVVPVTSVDNPYAKLFEGLANKP
jgi:peptidyl-prolyl cis-trans isomerase B (cyclophilin B)